MHFEHASENDTQLNFLMKALYKSIVMCHNKYPGVLWVAWVINETQRLPSVLVCWWVGQLKAAAKPEHNVAYYCNLQEYPCLVSFVKEISSQQMDPCILQQLHY